MTKPLSTEAVEGDTVIILCEVAGDPKPEVIWLRDFLKVNLPIVYSFLPVFRHVEIVNNRRKKQHYVNDKRRAYNIRVWIYSVRVESAAE